MGNKFKDNYAKKYMKKSIVTLLKRYGNLLTIEMVNNSKNSQIVT